MMSFGEFAAVLTAAAAEVEPGLVENTKVLMEAAEKRAKSMIGTYQDGWAPLSYATLHGGVSPEGHRYPGKIELGYSPPDNPLIRTGQLKDSIESKAEAMIGGAEGAIGSDDHVAVFHEMGTSRMPARPVFAKAMQDSLPMAEFLFGNLAVSILTGRK